MISLPTVSARPNGMVIYRGPSLLDGAEIVVIVVGLRDSSSNEKTGNMLQTYILRADRSPIEAVSDGADRSICGDCVHRDAGSCYVNVGQGPLSVWHAWKREIYPDADDVAALGEGRDVRMGSYGDPCAVPAHIWRSLISRATSHTGYTHQWRRAMAQEYRAFLMASCDTMAHLQFAWAKGWRTFRVLASTDSRTEGEVVCPASAEAGKRKTCAECGACDGAGNNPGRASITIRAHGMTYKVQRFERAIRALRQKKRYRHRQS